MATATPWPLLRAIGAIVIVVGLALFVAATQRLSREPLPPPPSPQQPPDPAKRPWTFASNADCKACHEEIYAEWQEDQHSMAWFNTPWLPQDPKRSECNNCHAPQPILQVGINELPLIRTDRFEEGVGCLECHQRHDQVEGPLPSADAACNPRRNAVFSDSSICNSCHAPHGSYDEWKASEWGRKGVTCQGCHMPEVERPSATGGAPRRVRSHRMRTQRDPTMLQESITLETVRDGGQLVVSLTNGGTGHNVPGEIYNRQMVVLTTFLDRDGAELESHREILKTVKREQRASETSTQLRPGEKRTWRYDPAPGAVRATVRVGYKFLFLLPDSTGITVHEAEVALP